MIRPTADNVVLRLLPVEKTTASGIWVPNANKRGEARRAEVIAVGPGHYEQRRKRLGDQVYTVDGPFVPTSVKPGDIVLVDPQAGQDYTLDLSIPRHNKGQNFDQIADERGEFRIVRESEILGVVEEAPFKTLDWGDKPLPQSSYQQGLPPGFSAMEGKGNDYSLSQFQGQEPKKSNEAAE